MSKKEDGGSAYPMNIACDPSGDILQGEEGMTLRDYFAGQALVAFLSDPSTIGSPLSAISASAYKAADAMLKERDK